MCKVSVIIPVYNVEKYIERCLKSVQEQTLKDLEVIIVDDGSTDGTGAICDRIAAEDVRIRVLHKQNEGVSIARNTGISAATGEYFAFWDGDDYVKPECLEDVCRIADRENCDSVIYGYHLVMDGKITETHPPLFTKECYEGSEILEEVIPKFIGVSYDDINRWIAGEKGTLQKENTALWHQLVRADLIREHQILFDPNLKVGEDTCFTTEYLSVAKKCCIVSECYYHLVVRETSTIYTYEKDALAVVEGKRALLSSRRNLTERIRQRSGANIENFWYGTVVMSCLQLGMMLANKQENISLKGRYRSWKSYLAEKETQQAIRNFHPHGNILKKVPFLLLKGRIYAVLFVCCLLLQKAGMQFER